MTAPTPYIKPAEPTHSLSDELRHLVTMLRAVGMQAGVLRKRAPGQLGYRIRLLDEQLHNSANSLVRAVVSTPRLGEAEDYFDNHSALYWEVLNEVRKCADPRQALAVLYALNAGQVIDHASGQAVNEMPFTEPTPQP
jgi:hypothetical protein